MLCPPALARNYPTLLAKSDPTPLVNRYGMQAGKAFCPAMHFNLWIHRWTGPADSRLSVATGATVHVKGRPACKDHSCRLPLDTAGQQISSKHEGKPPFLALRDRHSAKIQRFTEELDLVETGV